MGAFGFQQIFMSVYNDYILNYSRFLQTSLKQNVPHLLENVIPKEMKNKQPPQTPKTNKPASKQMKEIHSLYGSMYF